MRARKWHDSFFFFSLIVRSVHAISVSVVLVSIQTEFIDMREAKKMMLWVRLCTVY